MSDLSESFVASIARSLNARHIPCVLWGQYLLQVHGVPSIVSSVDFVVPDDCVETGAEVLTRLHTLTPCLDEGQCPTSSSERFTPPPSFHAHLADSEVTVTLYSQSETLWFLPRLSNSLLASDKTKLPSPFVLASDQVYLPPERPGRGLGFIKASVDPIIVLKSHILLEAFLRLYARDAGKCIGSFAMALIGYVQLYIDDDGFLEAEKLPEPLKTSYNELRYGDKPLRQWSNELKAALGLPKEFDDDDS